MSGARPDVSELEVAASDDLVFRFVRPDHINPSAPPGAQLQIAALPSNQFTPNERSYGASVFVKSKLVRGLRDLHDACPTWRECKVAEIPVARIVALGVGVVLSPQDCEFESNPARACISHRGDAGGPTRLDPSHRSSAPAVTRPETLVSNAVEVVGGVVGAVAVGVVGAVGVGRGRGRTAHLVLRTTRAPARCSLMIGASFGMSCASIASHT